MTDTYEEIAAYASAQPDEVAQRTAGAITAGDTLRTKYTEEIRELRNQGGQWIVVAAQMNATYRTGYFTQENVADYYEFGM